MLTFGKISHIRDDTWVSNEVVFEGGIVDKVYVRNDKGCW